MVAESLIRDGDIDLENNYAERHGDIFGRADLIVEGHARKSLSGALVPVHDIGLPVLLLPIYGTATRFAQHVPEGVLKRFRQNRGLFAYSLVGLTLIALTTAAALVFLGLLGTWMTPRLAAAAAVAVFLSPPILGNAFVVFPEVPALFISTLALYYAYRRGSTLRFREAAALALSIGLLPWFHRKYVPFAIGLAFVVAVRNRPAIAQFGRARLAVLGALVSVPVAVLILSTYLVWGNLAGPLAIERIPLSLETLKTGLLGLLVDRESGLLPWAALWFVWPAAQWVKRHDTPLAWLPILLVLLPSAAHDQWWGGWSPAVRFLVPVVPWIALPVALLLRERRGAIVLACLFATEVFVIGHCWGRPRSMWPQGDGVNAALDALPLAGRAAAAAFPSFRTADVGVQHAVLPLVMLAVVTVLVTWSQRRRP